MVIIDTSIWVEVLRTREPEYGEEVRRLLGNREAAMVGIVYAELLRGARTDEDLARLQSRLNAIDFLEADKETWSAVGQILSDLDRKGESIPLQDAVIAAQAIEGNHAVFTRDQHFARVPGLRLHEAAA